VAEVTELELALVVVNFFADLPASRRDEAAAALMRYAEDECPSLVALTVRASELRNDSFRQLAAETSGGQEARQ